MTQKWRDVRVFISSTFRDMDAERDMLVKRVFPQLRERLLPYRIHLIDIDLRWGITPEEAENDRVLDLCLEQIDVCRPFFLGILGERYGWVPNRIMLPEKPEYGWIQGMTGKSVTELEILYGVLRNPQMAGHAFFFFREPGALDNVPADALAQFRDSGANAEKLRALKSAVNDSPYPVTPYTADWDATHRRLARLDAFADAVLEQLWQGVKDKHQLPDTPPVFDDNPLEQERDFHDRFIESRSRVYIGRESTAEALRRFVGDDGTAPCLVTGPSGSGKSAALAKFVSDYRLQHPDAFVLAHFIGASPRSTGLRDMLRRLCEELKAAFGFEEEIPFDLNPLVNRFKEFIEKSGKNRDCPKRSEAETGLSQDFSTDQEDIGPISKAGTVPSPSQARSLGTVPVFSRVLLVLDALNQLDETDNAHSLFWLPGFPPNVKVILSCITEKNRDCPQRSEERAQTGLSQDFSVPDKQAQTGLSGLLKRLYHILVPKRSEERAQTGLSQDFSSHQEGIVPSSKSRTVPSLGTVPDFSDPILAAFDRWPHERVEIQPLTPKERFEIATEVPSISAKKLAPAQMQALLDNPATDNPLYLLVALEELRGFGSFEQLDRKIAAFPREGDTVTAIFTQVIERLEADFDPEDVHDVLTLLAAARSGLSEKELEDLLAMGNTDGSTGKISFAPTDPTDPSTDTDRLQPSSFTLQTSDLFPILRQIRAYLQHRGNRLDFFHRNFFKAARARYLDSYAKQRVAHARLADYLNTRWREPWQHALEDLPWHRIKAEQWQELIGDADTPGVLTDLLFIQAKCEAGLVHDLVGDYNAALAELPEFREENNWNLQRSEAMIAYNKALRDYAVRRADWRNRKEQEELSKRPMNRVFRIYYFLKKVFAPEPECPEMPEVLKNKDERKIPEEQSERAARLRHFANFVSGHLKPLADFPANTLPMALNWAEGPVAERAARQIQETKLPCLQRSPRPPTPPLRPQCLCTLEGHKNYVLSVCVTPDARCAISASLDKTLRLWDLASNACLRTLEGHTDTVASVCVTPDARRAISASFDKTLRLWDLASGACLRTLEGHTSWVTSVCVTPNGTRAISASKDDTLRLWDIDSGVCLRTLEGHTGAVSSVCVTPDARRALSASEDHTLRLWDLASGACLRTLEGHTGGVNSVCVTPDARRAISGGWDFLGNKDYALRLWDLESGVCLRTLEGHTDPVTGVCVTPDARRAISASIDETLRLWDLESGACLRTLKGHTAPVWSVCVTPDARRAISASSDKTLRLWDLDSGACLAVYHAGSWVRSAAISMEGNHILCGTKDGQIHFLTPVNLPPPGLPVVTAVCLWQFVDGDQPGHWDDCQTVQCPWCGRRFPVRDDQFGQLIVCPLEGCGGEMQVNCEL